MNTININFKTKKFNSSWGKYFLEIENINFEEKNKIKSITLKFENEFKI